MSSSSNGAAARVRKLRLDATPAAAAQHRLDVAESTGQGEDYDSGLDACGTPRSGGMGWDAASYAASDLAAAPSPSPSPRMAPVSPAPGAGDQPFALFDGAEGSGGGGMTPSSRSGLQGGGRKLSQPAPSRPLRIGRAGLAVVAGTPGEPADVFDPRLVSAGTPTSPLRDVDPASGSPASYAGSDAGSDGGGGGGTSVYSFRRPASSDPIPLTPGSKKVAQRLESKKTHRPRPLLKVATAAAATRAQVGEALAGEDYESGLEECSTPAAACMDLDDNGGTPCSFAPDDLDSRSVC